MNLLEVDGLCKFFDLSGGLTGRLLRGETILKAVDGVRFSIVEGKTLGVVGESGCGKSTTARLVARLVEPTAGEIRFAGKDVLGLDRRAIRELRRHVQMVFQDPFGSLNPRIKIIDIVGRPLTIYRGMNGQTRRREVERLLDLVGLLPDHSNHYAHELSGGQRQRVAIARALAPEPKLIIADEPVSALDLSVQAQILNLLRKLQRELKLTMLFISHDLNVIQYIAESIVVMYAGKVVETGTVREIFEKPLHPYTKGLLAASRFGSGTAEAARLGGEVVLPVNPRGCRLESRCPIRVPRCKTDEPPLLQRQAGHEVACHEV
jgi:oligopeptide/dipeptide ABC transporter ATP-binding protein